MAHYRIHQFDSHDRVLTSLAVECANDEEALRLFSTAPLRGQTMELWAGRRLVRRQSGINAPFQRSGRMFWPTA